MAATSLQQQAQYTNNGNLYIRWGNGTIFILVVCELGNSNLAKVPTFYARTQAQRAILVWRVAL